MSSEDLFAALPSNANAAPAAPATPAVPARSAVDQLGHVLGVGARAVVNGVTALPALAADLAIVKPINAGLSAVDSATGNQNGFRLPSTSQSLNDAMTAAGVASPETATERVGGDVVSAMAGTGATMALGKVLSTASGSLTRAVGAMLTTNPTMQLASSATGAAASGVTREEGGGTGAQVVAGLAGSLAPSLVSAPFRTVADAGKAQFAKAAQDAHDAGFVIPPADLSQGPATQLASAISGKVKTSQQASFQNQAGVNTLAKNALGMAPDETLDLNSLAALRNDASQAYQKVAGIGTVNTGQSYIDELDQAAKTLTGQAKSFPGMKEHAAVADIEALKTPQFDASDGLSVIQGMRNKADMAYRAGDKLAGAAYKDAANAVEGAIQDHLQNMGAPAAQMLKDYQDARQLIAKTYTVQDALNPTTGNVNAIQLAGQLKRGAPLNGDLKTIATSAQAFPKAFQNLKEAPGASSVLDTAAGLGTAAATHSMLGLAPVAARPAIRSALLSRFAQNHYVQQAGQSAAPLVPAGAGAIATTAGTQSAQTWDNGGQSPMAPMNRYQAGRQAFKNGGVVKPVAGGFVVEAGPSNAEPSDPAHAAATSPHNDLPEPTPGQKEAGNYKVGRLRVAGMDISVENPQDSVRRGVDADGTPWESKMQGAHYGYVRGTQAADGDHLDVFVKPGTSEDHKGPVFVIDQVHPDTGKFDEHKAVIGADNANEAEAIYRSNYAPDWNGMAAITKLPMFAFKAWAKSGKLKQPLGETESA